MSSKKGNLCISSGEKRKHEDSVPSEEPKKGKIDGDVSAELISEIIATITDPNEMVGPDVIIAWGYCF